MGAPTIPPPHKDEVMAARFSIKNTMERNGLDLNDPGVAQCLEELVAVKAQMMAENRWLSNIVHQNTGSDSSV